METGIILNGVDIVHLENEDYAENRNSDLRAALFHSIVLFLEEFSSQEFLYFSMKRTLVLAYKRNFNESDIIFYVILKPSLYETNRWRDLIPEILFEFKLRFSNLYNKFCELFDENLQPDISKYWKILPHLSNLLLIKEAHNSDMISETEKYPTSPAILSAQL